MGGIASQQVAFRSAATPPPVGLRSQPPQRFSTQRGQANLLPTRYQLPHADVAVPPGADAGNELWYLVGNVPIRQLER